MIRRQLISSLFSSPLLFFFFFNDTATTEIYTLSLHDALPICRRSRCRLRARLDEVEHVLLRYAPPTARALHLARIDAVLGGDLRDDRGDERLAVGDRKSTRLNSSHDQISYAVFCLKKKNTSTDYRAVVSWLHLHHRSRQTRVYITYSNVGFTVTVPT